MQMDEIRGMGKVMRKAYSYMVTESQGPHNEEVRHLRKSYYDKLAIMNIVLATPLYPPETEPLASYAKELSLRLADHHEVTIVAYASTSEWAPGAKLITVSKRRRLVVRLIKYTRMLWSVTKDADIIYAQNAVASGLPSLIISTLRNIPLVINFEEDEAWKSATQLRQTKKYLGDFLSSPEGSLRVKLVLFLQGFVLRHATTVLVQSKELLRLVSKYYRVPEQKIAVNYHIVDMPEQLPFASSIVSEQIVTICKLTKENNVGGIIRAALQLKEKFPEIKLLIAGYGPEEAALKSLTKELGLEKNVFFLGRVSHAEAWHITKSSAVYVHNPNEEFTPNNLFRPFVAGTPVVATRIPAMTEVVKEHISGLLVEAQNTDELSRAITRIFTDSTVATQLTRGARVEVDEKFSWAAHINMLMSVFELVLKK